MQAGAEASDPEVHLGFWEMQRQKVLHLGGGLRGSWRPSPGLAVVVVIGVFGLFGAGRSAQAATCPNEALRSVQSAAFLPDCRAFELVSPPNGEPNLMAGSDRETGAQASSAGGGIAWFSYYPLSDSLGGEFHDLSTRGLDGWTTKAIGPRLSPSDTNSLYCEPAIFFAGDLSQSVLVDGYGSGCSENDPVLAPNEPVGAQNVFLRDGATGAYALVNVTPEGVTPGNAWFEGASNDFNHIVFEDVAQLTSSAPAGASLYEWMAGAVHLVSVLPDGTPAVGVLPAAATGGGNFSDTGPITHAVSLDGTRVIFESGGKLFLRENAEQPLESARGPEGECLEGAKACTVQLDASRAGGSGGGGGFLAANATDSKIFFADDAAANLTPGTRVGSGQHLYEYDTSTGGLRDLTPSGELGLAGLSGISDDGSYLYVVAGAALATGATPGQPNLYVFHEGTPKFIATLGSEVEESYDWDPFELTARVSPNGRYIAFNSIRSLTGYDNTPAQPADCHVEHNTPGPCREIFLYDAVQGNLHCVSCAPGGEPPTAEAEIAPAARLTGGWGPIYARRNVLDDGRVFFDTADSLVIGAENGVSNVYEYANGGVSLISTGTSEANSFFYDASPSGDDLFFVTTQHLLRSDTGNGMRLYDARVDGGFPESEEGADRCSEGCREPGASASASPSLSSTSQESSGNPPEYKAPVLTSKQKLERALRACQRRKRARRRAACKRQARLKYGARSAHAKRRGGK
jgi:hypothetical protein